MAACSQNITLVPGIELSPQEANRYKNIFAVQVPMCEVFRAVLKWECSDKQLGQTYADYFGQKKQQYEEHHAALVAKKYNKLKLPKIGLPPSTMKKLQEEPSKYDVTLMFSFLCKIFKSKVFTHVDHVRSLSQLECLLKEAKNIRNAVMHEVADDVVNPMKFDEIVKAMHDVIDEAGNVYRIPADEVTSLKAQIDGMWDEVLTDNEKAKAYCCFFLQTYGNKEAKVMWEAMLSEETLLFGDEKVERSKVFHSLELTLQKPKDQPEDKISYTELLTGKDKFIVVIGDSGSGKSTLAKNLVIQHHGISDAKLEIFNLKNHNLLLYYECRNVSTTEFTDVVEENFENVCQKLGPETVIHGITESKPLILIDGYDECHKASYKVVQQIVNKMRNHECRVIITTRPSAADELKGFLKREGVKFQEYEILEISHFDDQLRFLEKYEKHVTPHAEKVVKSFSSLGRSIQELFVRPINLVLFCHLVWNFPERINDWKSHAAVAEVTYDLYEKIIQSKLAAHSIVDKAGLIDSFFQDLSEFSLKMISEHHLVFSVKQVDGLIRSIRSNFKEYGMLGRLDPYAFLGVVLRIKRSMKNSKSCTYFFHHKSIQELFASKPVVMELRKNNALPPILTQKIEWIRRREVLKYVFMELSAAEDCTVFWNNWPLLLKAIGCFPYYYAEEIVLNSPNSQHIAAAFAEVVLQPNDKWEIDADFLWLPTSRNVDAVALLLPHQQPATLSVGLLDNPAPESWRQVARTFTNKLELRPRTLSRLPYPDYSKPFDYMIEALSYSRCVLSVFEGRIEDPSSIQTLTKVATPDTEFTIVMPPHVDLTPLQDKHQVLWVIVEFSSYQGNAVPLPVSPHIFVLVKSIAENQHELLTRTLLGLSPADNRFTRLELCDCALTEAQLQETLAELQRAGLRTLFRGQQIHAGPSRALKIRSDVHLLREYEQIFTKSHGEDYVLILTDEPPLPPQSEPSRSASSKSIKSPASLPVAPAVGGENLCPLASSCGDLDAVYRSLYALNVVLPHALRFVLEKASADKPPDDFLWKYLATNCQRSSKKYDFSFKAVQEVLEKCNCEAINSRPFDALPLIQFVSNFLEVLEDWSQIRVVNELGEILVSKEPRDYKNLKLLMVEVLDLRYEVFVNQCDYPPDLIEVPDRITDIAYELISEAAELHRVPDAEAERVKEACQALSDKYSDVRVDDDAFAVYRIVKENRDRNVDLKLKYVFDVGVNMSPGVVPEPLLDQQHFMFTFDLASHTLPFGNLTCKPNYSAMHGFFIRFKCRDTDFRSFSDVIEKNFPAACSQIGVQNVEYVLINQYAVIFIEGYDEANATSSVVVEEIINKFHKFRCKLVIAIPEVASSQRNIFENEFSGIKKSLILPHALKK